MTNFDGEALGPERFQNSHTATPAVAPTNRRTLLASSLLLLAGGCRLTPEQATRDITLEVAVFEGGYGLDWHRSIAREYERLHPGIRVHLWGDPRVDEKLKPRILRHNPPDLASCKLPVWKLIVANKLQPLDEALASPAYGQNRAWRDTLTPGVLTEFQYQGHTYAMPSNLGAWVYWYNRKQFREHGWQVPRTWQQFTTLCEQIKRDRVAPLAFQGKYAAQYGWPALLSLYQRLVPFETWYTVQDFQPGAFQNPKFIEAAGKWQQIATQYIQRGALAMTHTESQMEWVNGRAALTFCGLWLGNEMKEALPSDFEMACFPMPRVEEGQGDPNAIYGGGAENFFVFREGKHPRQAMDFLKFMLSRDSARSYTQRLNTLSPVRDAVEGLTISPALQSAVQILEYNTRFFADRLQLLYLEFGKADLPDAMIDLMNGQITPQAFGEQLERAAERIRRNPDIYKPPAMGVPPV